MRIPDIISNPVESIKIRSRLALAAVVGSLCVIGDEQGLIVQIGAHDGRFDDPIGPDLRDTICPPNRVVLIEPQEDLANGLRNRYPGAVVIRCAVSNETTNGKPLYTVMGDHGTAIGSFNEFQVREEAARNGIDFEAINQESVPTRTPSDLELDVGRIASLIVDTEGCDANIVNMFLDDPEFNPPVILWERLHVPDKENIILKKRLRESRYRLFDDGKDVYCVKKDSLNKGLICRVAMAGIKKFFIPSRS